MFFELFFQEGQSEARSYEWNLACLTQNERYCADVIFVCVGQHNGEHITPSLTQVREIREDEIYSWLMFFREEHSGIDDKNFSVMFKDSHVPAHIA